MPRRAISESGARAGERPQVVYIMGAGRSGSTILGVTLGNCADVFFAGELDHWLAKSGVPAWSGAERASFWNGVRGEIDDADEHFGGRLRVLERSSALLDPRNWPARRRLRDRYRRIARDLYVAIERASGMSHLVDSSHYPLRAYELQGLEDIDMFLLFLVRDPQRVVASLGRRDVRERRFGTLTANAYLYLTHALSVAVFLRHPRARRLLVRHEDFLATPERVLEQILHTIGCAGAPPDLNTLRTGVPFHGNRLIDSELVSLEREAPATARASRLTSVIQLPWRAVFSRLRPSVSAPPHHERSDRESRPTALA